MCIGAQARAKVAHHLRAGGAGQATGVGQAVTMGDGIQEGAGKHASGPIGVHGLHRYRIDMQALAAVAYQCSTGTARDRRSTASAHSGLRANAGAILVRRSAAPARRAPIALARLRMLCASGR